MLSSTSPSNACGLPPGESESSPALMLDWSLGTLVALLVAVLAFAWYRNDPQFANAPPWYWQMKLAWGADADLVIVGDSTVYRGLNPQILEDRGAATKAVNFGFSSAALSGEYLFDAATKLDPDSKRRYMVVGVTHWALTPNARKANGNGYVDAQVEDSKRRSSVVWMMVCDVVFARLLPVQIDLLFASSPSGDHLARATEDNYIQVFNLDGWVNSDFVVPDPHRGIENRRRSLTSLNGVETELVEEARNALQLLQDRDGVQVVLVPMHSSTAVDELSAELSGIALTDLARAVCPSRGVIFNFQPTEAESYDGIHLNGSGASRVSRDLADFLRNGVQ